MRKYHKMATEQKQNKGPPVSVIIGGVAAGVLLFGIMYLANEKIDLINLHIQNYSILLRKVFGPVRVSRV